MTKDGQRPTLESGRVYEFLKAKRKCCCLRIAARAFVIVNNLFAVLVCQNNVFLNPFKAVYRVRAIPDGPAVHPPVQWDIPLYRHLSG